MSQLSSTGPSVYTGVWINWTRTRIEGTTLTLSIRDSVFLVAFLALYVRLSGNRLWNIVCFVTFLLRSTLEPRDGLYHQQQALLKAKPSDLSSIWQHFRLGWEWKDTLGRRSAIHKSLGLTLLSAAHAAAFITAGIFSSKVTNTVSDVLLNNASCGSFPIPLFGTPELSADHVRSLAAISARVQRNLASASAYSSYCYKASPTHTSWSDCRSIGKTRIQWNRTTIPCPFGGDICRGSAIRFDSGRIDSHTHLGINTPQEDRVSYRRVMQCAPLKTEGYRRGPLDAASAGIPQRFRQPYDDDETYYGYFYGSNRDINTSATYYIPSRRYPSNSLATVSITNVQGQYALTTEAYTPGSVANPFIAIPELQLPDASTNLIFLQKMTNYLEPVNDPWFHATTPVTNRVALPDGNYSENITVYSDPEVVSVLGCTENWQWCNVHTNECTPFQVSDYHDPTSVRLTAPARDKIHLNPRQTTILNRIYSAAGPSIMNPMITLMGAPSLLASKYAAVNSPKLPDDQWIQELDHYFGTSMAALQLGIVQYVIGGDGEPWEESYRVPPTADQKWMCTSQITERTDYTSFSVLAICLIIIIGGLIMLVSVFLNEVLVTIRRFRHTRRGKHWIASGVYQLQARVFEAKGLGGPWTHMDKPTPVTKTPEVFSAPVGLAGAATLVDAETSPISDIEHTSIFSFRSKDKEKLDVNVDIGGDAASSLADLDTKYSRVTLSALKSPLFRTTTKTSSLSEAETLLSENGYKMQKGHNEV